MPAGSRLEMIDGERGSAEFRSPRSNTTKSSRACKASATWLIPFASTRSTSRAMRIFRLDSRNSLRIFSKLAAFGPTAHQFFDLLGLQLISPPTSRQIEPPNAPRTPRQMLRHALLSWTSPIDSVSICFPYRSLNSFSPGRDHEPLPSLIGATISEHEKCSNSVCRYLLRHRLAGRKAAGGYILFVMWTSGKLIETV